MSKTPSIGETLRSLVEKLIRFLGRLFLPVVILLMRSIRLNTKALEKRSKSIQQVIGLLSLITIALVLIIVWGGWQLISILILHTWAMLLFAKTESFLHINIPRRWRQFMVVLQIAFIVVLSLINYQLSLLILAVFLFIAKVSNLLFFESLFLYSIFLQKDRFDAEYWWQKKQKSPKTWNKTIQQLLKKRYLNSLVRVIWEFLKSHERPKMQQPYTSTILHAWVKLRRYQILPDDLVLNYQQSNKLAGRSPQSRFLIGTACNFKFMQMWIELCKKEEAFARLLADYLTQLSRELETYIQKPFPLDNISLKASLFVEELDQFLNQDFKELTQAGLEEQIKYCYGLFYMTRGIAQNL